MMFRGNQMGTKSILPHPALSVVQETIISVRLCKAVHANSVSWMSSWSGMKDFSMDQVFPLPESFPEEILSEGCEALFPG